MKIERTKETCQETALKYKTKRDFYLNDKSIYNSAYNIGFLDEICQHMIKLGNRFNKCVYCYEFPDNSVYVGITNDFHRRDKDRKTRQRDSVILYINKTGLIPVHLQLTEYISVELAVKLENEYVEKYRLEGWKILNKIKTGGRGGDILYWTKERCIEEAKKYSNRTDFNLKSKGAYDSARKHGWLSECHTHMPKVYYPFKITKERCLNEAKKYNNITDWRKHNKSTYDAAKRNNWFIECTGHMTITKVSIWTKEKCLENARKYKSITSWIKNEPNVAKIVYKNNWNKECTSHMTWYDKNINT